MQTLDPSTLSAALGDTLALLEALPDAPLRMAALYGSAARDDFDPERSDVNLLLAFDRMPGLGALADVLQRARSRFRCAPLVLTTSELGRLAVIFPVKLMEMRRHYRILAGEDLLASQTASFDALRRACEHDLRNAQLKLRRTGLLTHPDPRPLLEALHRFLPQIVGALRCLLDHAGAPDLDTLRGLRSAAQDRLDIDLAPLEAALKLRHRTDAPWPEVEPVFEALAGLLARLLARLDRLEGL